jgi:hypothetical protein
MKILIGYDGSDCSDAALKDLKRAGLPQRAEALVLSVADVFLPPPIDDDPDNTSPMYVPSGIRRAHEGAERKLKEAESKAKQASQTVIESFPEWQAARLARIHRPGHSY